MPSNKDIKAVRILDANGAELKPTTNHKKVRKLLQSGKAKIESYDPFTVRLLYEVLDIEPPVAPAKEDLQMSTKVENINEAKGFIIGKCDSGHFLSANMNQNFMAIGHDPFATIDLFSSRMIMQCAANGNSMVVVSSFADYYSKLYPYLRKEGYDVRELSFPRDAKGNFENMITNRSEAEMRLVIEQYASDVISECKRCRAEENEKAATALLEALIVRVARSRLVPIEKKTVLTVQEILAKPDVLHYLDRLFDADYWHGKNEDVAGRMLYRSFRCSTDEKSLGVISDMIYDLDLYILNHPELTRIDVEPMAGKVAFFVNQVSDDCAKMVKAAVHSIGAELFATADKKDGMKFEKPVFVIVEDVPKAFGNLTGDISGIIRMANRRNIYFGLTFMDVPELMNMYGVKAQEKLMKVSRLFQMILHFGDPSDTETNQYLSDLFSRDPESADSTCGYVPGCASNSAHCFEKIAGEEKRLHTIVEPVPIEQIPEYEEIKRACENR